MTLQRYLWPIIESRPAHGTVIHSESRNPNNVQWRPRRSTEPRDVPGVRRNLRFDEGYVDHDDDANVILFTDDRSPEKEKQKERRLLLKCRSFRARPCWPLCLCAPVRVADATPGSKLSLLCGFLGSAALLCGLLGSALFRCLLSTFLSCHSHVLLFSSLDFSDSSS